MIKSSAHLDRIKPLLEKTVRDSRAWDMALLDAEKQGPVTVAFLNQHGINTSIRIKPFYDFLLNSDYLLRDGIGVKLALKLFGLGETENLNGTDLITAIINRYQHRRLAIFGASDETMIACRQRLEREGISGIVAMENGFHEDDYYLSLCRSVKPDVVVLCMGMPRQEILAAKLKDLALAKLIICGGGWADFYSGIKIRAPLWVRKLSLEWMHRLLKEPRRLGKRYTVDIVYYFCVIVMARFLKVK
ncbi:MAG: glycosyltransferase [Micavibrio aeruginosavorus]|uniref:Glycosyltransferase n=1 Tax=Micavibrio aeruginosavorus TaxID=349221 RepID=A0A2W5HCL1_9BACT|nr:MAG: glycosyltransferase [Micavibrio aeruginosavorus]